MSTPTPDPQPPAPFQQPGGPDETEPTTPTAGLPAQPAVEVSGQGASIDEPAQEQRASDDYGTPSPPDRGAQHEFDAPPAAPPESEAFPWPAAGQPAPNQPPVPAPYPPPPPAYQPPAAPAYQTYQQPAPTGYPQSSPAPYPATGASGSQPPPMGFPPSRPDGFGPPSGGYSVPQGAYPPYGYAPVDPYAKSRTVAGILGILLGGLGVHRFYLGYVGIGVLQIVVTVLTFGVGAIWGFVEGILYLTQRTGQFSVDSTGRYLRE